MHHSFALRASLRHVPGLRAFLTIWFGQLVSMFGSALTSFALGLWAYQRTGSVTAYSLLALAVTLPYVFLSPLAGVAADRFDRRKVMILSDMGAGLCTLTIALLLWSGRLEIWHLAVINLVSAACNTFQWPAYSAATTQLVAREHLGRVNGLVGIVQAATSVLAPTAAGALVLWVGVPGVLLVDFCTFLFAVSTLLLVRFPSLPPSAEETPSPSTRGRLAQDLLFGWRYLIHQPGLLGLLLFLALFNYLWKMVSALAAPLVLNFGDAQTLGTFITVAGTGMLVGSLVMGAWGGFKKRIVGVTLFELLSGVCFVMMGLVPNFWRIALAAFGAHFTIAFIDSSNKSIWQSRVPQSAQGRVFSVWQMVATAAAPLAYLSAGPLADGFFEPLMRAAGPMSGTWIAGLVGLGTGRGIGLIFVIMGILKVLSAAACYLVKPVREVEDAAA